MNARAAFLLLVGTLASGNLLAAGKVPDSPQASERSSTQNYKDMVLAECIATAYKDQPQAAADAGSSAGALVNWSYFDMENAPAARKELVQRYLARDYRNPLAEAERPGIRFDLLKCLDLYHSKALDTQARKMVIPGKR